MSSYVCKVLILGNNKEKRVKNKVINCHLSSRPFGMLIPLVFYYKPEQIIKSMEKIVIGIDISAKALDICIKKSNDYSLEVIENDSKPIKIFLKKIQKTYIPWKSLGLIRGKNDKIDARRICDFTDKNEQDLILWKPCSETIKKIKVLFSERNSNIKTKSFSVKAKSSLFTIRKNEY